MDSSKVSMYIDRYNNFGWETDINSSIISEKGNSFIRLKRNRKIMNKVELTRLQRNFEHCMKQIDSLEKSKETSGLIISLAIGLFGTGFIVATIFLVLSNSSICMVKYFIWYIRIYWLDITMLFI